MSKSRSKAKNNSAPSIFMRKQGISDKLKRPFDKYKAGLGISETWSKWGTRQEFCEGNYITLDEFGMVSSGTIMDEQSRAVPREDIEAGHHNL